MYIRASTTISPQKTFGESFLSSAVVEHKGNRLTAIEPEYKDLIDIKLIRRMSRIIKMGVATAAACLKEARVDVPDAIITGSAYGCLEDTGVFLKKMVENNEEMLTPTAFIQSTHNTVGAQIALSIKCHHYNNTFVHRGFSFESALLDAIMLLKDNEAKNVLAGSVDEITDYSHAILSRMGIYRNSDISNMDLYHENDKGTIAGEGAAFFLLTMQASGHDHAKLDGLHTFYKPAGIEDIKEQVLSFLSAQSLNAEDIDLLITGMNGDSNGDSVYKQLNETLFSKTQSVGYKHLCGEYPTSTSFALWLATNIVKEKALPAMLNAKLKRDNIKTILIYNHYKNIHHSLLLVSAC